MSLSVALFQMDIRWCDPAANLSAALAFLERSEAPLVLFPEMFTTGFCTDERPPAEEMDGPALTRLREACLRWGKAAAGSVAVCEGGRLFNRLLFVRPDGEVEWYDKRHLFTPGGEERLFTPGGERRVVEWGGMRWLLATCYDLRFPVWLRNRGDYDVLLCVASWPASRREVWQTLLRARAIENVAYVLGVNRVGSDPVCDYAGDSAAVDFCGRTLALGGSRQCAVEARLDPAALDAFRRKFDVARDADPFRLL